MRVSTKAVRLRWVMLSDPKSRPSFSTNQFQFYQLILRLHFIIHHRWRHQPDLWISESSTKWNHRITKAVWISTHRLFKFVQICSSSRAFISIFSSLEWASSNAAHHVTPAMPTNRPKSNDLNNVKLTSTMLHRQLTIAEYSRPKPLSIQNDSRR